MHVKIIWFTLVCIFEVEHRTKTFLYQSVHFSKLWYHNQVMISTTVTHISLVGQ